MAIPSKNVLGNPNVTEGNFQIAIEQLRESVIGSGKTYDSANTYMAYDICYYSGVVYYSKIDSNTGNTPSIGSNWGDYTDLLLGVVHKTGNETVAGVKTFSSNTIFNENVGIGTSDTKSKLSIFSGGGWSSNNFGKQLYLTTNNNFCNPCIGISDANGVNNISIANVNGEITFSAMPSITDSSTAQISRLVIDTSGNVLVTGSGGLGYGTGSSGTVTQLTSKSTTVTLNKHNGKINMHNEALAAGASVTFQFSNSLLTSWDNIYVELGPGISGWNNYRIECAGRVSENVVMLRLTNISGASLSEYQSIRFVIIKGANS